MAISAHGINPYNSRSPSAPFVGREAQLTALVDGLAQGSSFLIVGGRRMGKSSMLCQLGKRCGDQAIAFHSLSLQEAPALLTAAWVWSRIVSSITSKSLKIASDCADPYELARAALKDWSAQGRVVVTIDEADVMMTSSDCTTFFNNFRHFIGDSPWAGRIVFVATAVHGLAWFKTQGSPLNNMSEVRLARLSADQVQDLAALGCELSSEMLERVEELCGGHPYLVQGTLERLWTINVSSADDIDAAASTHASSSPVFRGWWDGFTPSARAMYMAYAARKDWLAWSEARTALGIQVGEVSEAQLILAYHGVIELGAHGAAMCCGTLFGEWVMVNATQVSRDVPERPKKPSIQPALPIGEQARQGYWWLRNDSDTVFVFVHGILSDSVGCWRADPVSDQDAFWPWIVATDPRLNHPSVYLAGYHAGIDNGCFGVENAADSLWTRLTTSDAQGNPAVTSYLNIVFVAHSMGGLVVRQMLRANPPLLREKHIGVLLVASPSRGSKWSDAVGAALGSVVTHRQGRQLEYDNKYLKELNEAFRGLLDGGAGFKVSGRDLFEHHFPMKRLRWFTTERIVKAEDNDAFFSKKKVIAGTDHFSIAKPKNAEESVHIELVNYFQSHFVSKLPEGHS
jgi:hypothetical protein